MLSSYGNADKWQVAVAIATVSRVKTVAYTVSFSVCRTFKNSIYSKNKKSQLTEVHGNAESTHQTSYQDFFSTF